jgi:hypothetical protein
MLPDILFPSRRKILSQVKFPINSNNIPRKLLSFRAMSSKSVVFSKDCKKLRSPVLPLPRWLEVKLKKFSLFNFSKVGTDQVRLFRPSPRYSRFVALDIVKGIKPVNWLELRARLCRLGSVMPKFKGGVPSS